MFSNKIVSLTLFALLGSVSATFAGSGHPDAATVRAAFAHQSASSAPKSSAAAATTTPLLTFSMLGTATSTVDDGPCPGVTSCNSSNDGCNCLTFQGSLNGTQVGNATWTAMVTINTDDCPNTGTTTAQGDGFCCYAGGPINASSGSNTLAMSFSGLVCQDPNAALQLSVQGGFIIFSGAGKFANSAGTGQLNMSVADDDAGSTYLVGNGVLQVVSPL
jgi:hypothetical protein